MAEDRPTDAVWPEDWCEHNPEWCDDAGRCRHPRCMVTGRQVHVYFDEDANPHKSPGSDGTP